MGFTLGRQGPAPTTRGQDQSLFSKTLQLEALGLNSRFCFFAGISRAQILLLQSSLLLGILTKRKSIVCAVALMDTPSRCRAAGRSEPLDGAAWAGGAASFTGPLSAHAVPNCDPGSLCAVCLPGVVGSVANSAPQLLCLFLWWGEARGQGAVGHKELLWPVNGAAPWCGRVGAEPLVQCLRLHGPPAGWAHSTAPSSHLSCSAHSSGLSFIIH